MNNEVRVRFAPSPTGYLHLGSVRTALYNWLFARHYQGKFILRIEDTDELRSTKEAVEIILEGLEWLGLDWDEGPCFQMQRLEIYKSYTQQLLNEDKTYYCYCSPEELEDIRQSALAEKKPPKYDGRCRYLTEEEKKEYETQGRKPVIRFKTPKKGETKFTDLVHGEVKFENILLDDFVLLKANGVPTYNYAVVIDDHLMKISHVLRGDDHISNTPRQILLYQASGWEPPQFAHFPMILGLDHGKLSKRHGAISVVEYKHQGYLPEALLNYLALLGWGTTESEEIFALEELIKKFSLERCGKAAAVFDPQKLLWINGLYIREMPVEELYPYALEELKKAELVSDTPDEKTAEYIKKAISLEQEKIKILTDIPYLLEFFLKEDIVYQEEAVNKVLKVAGVEKILADLEELFAQEENFNTQVLENKVRQYCQEKNLNTKATFHPLRVAVSGRREGPCLFKMLELLGKERVIRRIKRSKQILSV